MASMRNQVAQTSICEVVDCGGHRVRCLCQLLWRVAELDIETRQDSLRRFERGLLDRIL